MPKITYLPQNILELIFGHVPAASLLSASLTTRRWSQVYKRHCCKNLHLQLSSDVLHVKIALLERWKRLGLLRSVQHIIVTGQRDHGQDVNDLFRQFCDEWLPECTSLKTITWDVSETSAPTSVWELSNIPPGVWLDLICQGSSSPQSTASMLSALRDHDGLRSLTVEFNGDDEASLGSLLKDALLGCKNLRHLNVNVTSAPAKSDLEGTQIGSTNECALSWSTEEAKNLPALHNLEICYPSLAGAVFEAWAEHGNWAELRTLVAHHGWLLESLTGRLPALESLTVSTLGSLSSFLGKLHALRNFAVKDLKPSRERGSVDQSLRSILHQPFAAELNNLELRITKLNDEESDELDFSTIALCCPQLQSLTVAIGRNHCATAVRYFCWISACIEASIRMPRLSRLCIILPRLISSGSISTPPEAMTLSTASDIRSSLASYGKSMQEVRIVALLSDEIAQSERETAVLQYLSSENLALTYIASPAEKDRDAERGAKSVSCPELERAKAHLSAGRTSCLHPTGEYSLARRTIDDISSIAHVGTIATKKKPLPMPVWLTPWQEQDRREGPPGTARRAKRAIIRGMDEFLGTWRLPMAERARTPAEREARETGIGGRPGWSKSSLASRMFWSR